MNGKGKTGKRSARVKSTEVVVPTPIHTDGRTCFAIAFFLTEADAQAFGDYYKAHGSRYHGGYMDGMPTGRDSSFDFVVRSDHKESRFMGSIARLDVGTKIYAATY